MSYKEPPNDTREVRVTLSDGRKGIGFHYPLSDFWEVWAEDVGWTARVDPEMVIDWSEIEDVPIEGQYGKAYNLN